MPRIVMSLENVDVVVQDLIGRCQRDPRVVSPCVEFVAVDNKLKCKAVSDEIIRRKMRFIQVNKIAVNIHRYGEISPGILLHDQNGLAGLAQEINGLTRLRKREHNALFLLCSDKEFLKAFLTERPCAHILVQ